MTPPTQEYLTNGLGFQKLWTLPVTPCSAPRMVQGDRWKQRAPVLKYRKFKDDLRAAVLDLGQQPETILPECPWLVFHLPVPPSWSQRKKRETIGQPHTSKPDIDNLIKATLDTLLSQDSTKGDQHVWEVRGTKLWALQGSIEIWEQPSHHEILSLLNPHRD